MATARNVRVVERALASVVEQIVRIATLDIVANLVRAPGQGGTPVDTGWARANWIPNIGGPSTFDGTPPEDRSQVGAARSAQQSGLAAAAGFRLSQQSVVISNNVPYIGRLNAGHSMQAPANFVQAAITKAITQDLPGKLRTR